MTEQNNRTEHSLGVAKKMKELALQRKPGNMQYAEDMYILGLVHDIGYTLSDKNHAMEGGFALMRQGYKYWEVVLNHGNPYSTYWTEEFFMLNEADMSVDMDGKEVSFDERLLGIEKRYGPLAEQTVKAREIVYLLRAYLESSSIAEAGA